MKYRLVYITCANQREANRIGRILIRERLAACINIIPNIKSIYRWKGKIIKEKEALLLAKTTDGKLNKLIKLVKQMHSYKVPCIVALDITKGNKDFLKWINKSLT